MECKEMNAIKFLVNEHEKVRKLMTEIADPSHREETKKKMFDTVCQELLRHESMEETIWYPKLKNDTKLAPIIKHLISEEKKAEKLMKEFAEIKSDEQWDKKFADFRKEIEHHASEEEEKLFPVVSTLLSVEQLEEIGQEMKEFKKEQT
jgi:hemerythrin superfamily protein